MSIDQARPAAPAPVLEIGDLATCADITLRRLVVRNPDAVSAVLLLHGFPETLSAWIDIARGLAGSHEVHAFDWPGYGLSSRPPADRFSYAPRDYARVLGDYIDAAGLDRSKLTIYATDIGALPALLAALDDPGIARQIIVGDFAPFDRPDLMQPNLRALKSPASAGAVRAQMNLARDEILANVFYRGLSERYDLPAGLPADMARGWDQGAMTSVDAFAHYYSHFTADQAFFEARAGELETPVKVVWGEGDLFIGKAMGEELAARLGADLTVLPGVGHYPHLQAPQRTLDEIRAVAS